MLFNSWIFPVFLLVVLACYAVLPHKGQNRMLLVASYFFYGYWDWRFLFLLFASTLVDYAIGMRLDASDRPATRRWLVFASCAFNLGLLGVFKYYNFFISSMVDMGGSFGLPMNPATLNIVLPVGISFYTFQTMSYTIDVYRGSLRHERNFLDFALFVSFFPQLVAGPIERAACLLPQLTHKRVVGRDDWIEGGWLILKGYFLKMVVADNLAAVVNSVFSVQEPASGFVALMGVYAFAFQIYGDFAGYTSIARGVARLFGVRLMRNFNMPYLATCPPEFWQRWHISLSTWLRDYLYIPLGGNRNGTARTYRNLMLTMVLGGLWHGAAWTFLAWGAFQGAILVVHRLIQGDSKRVGSQSAALAWVKRILFFQVVCVGWLIFRAESFAQMLGFLRAIFTHFSPGVEAAIEFLPELLLFVGLAIALDAVSRDVDNPREIRGWNYGLGPAVCATLVLLILLLTPLQQQSFVYFQF